MNLIKIVLIILLRTKILYGKLKKNECEHEE